MSQSSIVRTSKGLYCIYTNQNSLYVRTLTASIWTRQQTVSQNIHSRFTVAVATDEICVLYQQGDGSICLACEKNNWVPRIILRHTNTQSPNVIIHSIMQKNGMQLLYNTPSGNEQNITLQYRQGNEMWSHPYNIDSFLPFESKTFRLIRQSDDKYILLYIKRMPEERVGYRIITPEKIGNFQNIYATGYSISDYSVFIRNDILHLVFLVSTPFSRQLIYTDTNGTKPTVLSESRGMSNCCISFINEKIYIWWLNNNRLYHTISYDYGTSFSPTQRYQNHIAENTIKSEYITTLQDKNFAAGDICVRENTPWDIQLIGDIYPDFFCCTGAQNKDEISDMQKTIAELQARLNAQTAELEQKNEKIYQLNRQLKMKTDELVAMERKHNA
jgi:hypothetical protein